MPAWESACKLRAYGPQWPTVEQPSEDEEELRLWSREELWVKITVCPRLQPSHTTNITISRIKCERYIFIKKCVRSSIEVRHCVWLCSASICIFVVYNRLALNWNLSILKVEEFLIFFSFFFFCGLLILISIVVGACRTIRKNLGKRLG